ncbi:MAG TPA: 23S rRNA (guanosine(2251)-2'-O)-methyltransferase RlmB [Myxococcaceae bacterium]|nr:23S rRNA (guanosine(2251)-2'-O)-methyltransferase RlmB [Myxococcaceae bacterium]
MYGVNPVLELLRARPEEIEDLFVASGGVGAQAASEVFSRARDAGIRVQQISRERLAAMADGGTHQGVLARVREFDYADLTDLIESAKSSDRQPLVVVLDGIQDPQNLGAIIRSSYALGAHGVVIGKDRAAQVTGLVSKTSAGAVAHLPVARVVNVSRALEELKEAGFWVAAADVSGAQSPADAALSGPLVLVVGAEGEGVRQGVLKHCDFKLRIPMAGELASLNASVSAGILLYEVMRQRAGRQTGNRA